VLDAQALIARLAAIVPPPKRHVIRYFGVLSSHSALRRLIVHAAVTPAETSPPVAPNNAEEVATPKPVRKSKYIPWHELLRRTFGIDVRCPRCDGE
jgi:Putative transposase